MELGNLPRLICGPILRRVDDSSVTVWLVLRREDTDPAQSPVELKVSKRGGSVVMTGSCLPMTLDQLHIVTVCATGALVPGESYDYRLRYRSQSIFADPAEESECNFVYMPTKLEDVRVVHASCRKPDGEGHDAMAALQREIQAGRVERPHLLLLTGDQIYADGVAGPLLFLIMDAVRVLLGGLTDLATEEDEEDVLPYSRIPLLEKAKIRHSYKPDCHLVSFQEYLLMHLFVWSEALWGSELPTVTEADTRMEEFDGSLIVRGKLDEYTKKWDRECARLRQFRADLPDVRRLLRSTPTLMIFDDHEVTDDWRLNEKWIKDVLGTPLGRRIELNALLAYILAQASGNHAEYFNLLIAKIFRGNDVAAWRQRDAKQPGAGLATLLGWEELRLQQMSGDSPSIKFHYHVELPACHVVALDTRTRRTFDRGEYASLIGLTHMADEIAGAMDLKPLLLVSPSPLFGHIVTEVVQATLAEDGDLNHDVYEWLDPESMRRIPADQFDPLLNVDAEAWALESQARIDLVRQLCNEWKLAPFIVVLSGDIHYAYTASVSLEQPAKKKIVQLTSSAILNREGKSDALAFVRPDVLPGWTSASKALKRFEGNLRYTLEMHKATIETGWSGTPYLARLFFSLFTIPGKVEQVKHRLRPHDLYVCGQNNVGVISFSQPGQLTHTLFTESLGDPAYLKWTVPL